MICCHHHPHHPCCGILLAVNLTNSCRLARSASFDPAYIGVIKMSSGRRGVGATPGTLRTMLRARLTLLILLTAAGGGHMNPGELFHRSLFGRWRH